MKVGNNGNIPAYTPSIHNNQPHTRSYNNNNSFDIYEGVTGDEVLNRIENEMLLAQQGINKNQYHLVRTEEYALDDMVSEIYENLRQTGNISYEDKDKVIKSNAYIYGKYLNDELKNIPDENERFVHLKGEQLNIKFQIASKEEEIKQLEAQMKNLDKDSSEYKDLQIQKKVLELDLKVIEGKYDKLREFAPSFLQSTLKNFVELYKENADSKKSMTPEEDLAKTEEKLKQIKPPQKTTVTPFFGSEGGHVQAGFSITGPLW